ncbi:MAG: hypothetical protein ABI284_05250 [Nitrosospira sp.]
MHKRWRNLASITIALVYSVGCAGCEMAERDIQQSIVELELARPATSREAIWIQVHAGALPRGTEIRVSTSKGVLLGTVSPFGGPQGPEAVTYIIPLPQTALVGNRVQLRLEVDEPGAPVRAPRSGEVESINLIHVPISH